MELHSLEEVKDKVPSYLYKTMEKFQKLYKFLEIPKSASGRCWDTTMDFVERWTYKDTCKAKRVLFGKQHRDYTKVYPVKILVSKWSDHWWIEVKLQTGQVVNIDFTARQFNHEVPVPCIWFS